MLSVNDRALAISRQLADAAEAYGVAVSDYENGVTVIDCGIEASGSLEAGRLFSEICLGGLGSVQLRELHLDGLVLPGVEVSVSHPVVACMASQYAGWAVKSPQDRGLEGVLRDGLGSGAGAVPGRSHLLQHRLPRPGGRGRAHAGVADAAAACRRPT